MGKLVCSGAMLKCSFGMAPGTLNVLPMNCVMSGAPSANIMDNIPMTVAPWVPGSPTVQIANMPALNDGSKLMCNWGGSIEVSMPGQMTVEVA